MIQTPGPVRTCVGCRRRAAKSELVRVVAGTGSDGRSAVLPDLTATAPGRGAHVHPAVECHELAERRRAYSRGLRVQGQLDASPVGEHIIALTEGVVVSDGDPPQNDRPETGAGSS
ncbi:YlxR family protein [Nocardioides yefusunii]|uniref:YlxR family protein n=1 Tax=Nocardioides yefusunii TaxID=2500546 RepID=A0ABW1QWF5_9ACTN|nr:YlxR family protein [Nocardioides yefusunii]